VKASYGYGRGHRALEIVSIILFFAALMSLGYRTVEAVSAEAPVNRWPLAISVIGGYLLADFLSGMAHWAGDTVGDEHTPFIGRNFVTPFRMHHVDPKDITRHDFIETNGNSSIASLPALTVLLLITPRTAGPLLYLCAMLAIAALFVFCTNQFHKWAHADTAPRAVQWLQRVGIILSPQHHAIHHAAPHDKYYCITVGWMNPLLTRVRFFRACEAVLGWVLPSLLHLADRQKMAGDVSGAAKAKAAS
jgi:sterol desaturase/sphingolipid hydroxylase (fatty acid hydroxylase superfamily)